MLPRQPREVEVLWRSRGQQGHKRECQVSQQLLPKCSLLGQSAAQSHCSTSVCKRRLPQIHHWQQPRCCYQAQWHQQPLPSSKNQVHRGGTSIEDHMGNKVLYGSACTTLSYSCEAGPVSASVHGSRGRMSTSQSIRKCQCSARICKSPSWTSSWSFAPHQNLTLALLTELEQPSIWQNCSFWMRQPRKQSFIVFWRHFGEIVWERALQGGYPHTSLPRPAPQPRSWSTAVQRRAFCSFCWAHDWSVCYCA